MPTADASDRLEEAGSGVPTSSDGEESHVGGAGADPVPAAASGAQSDGDESPRPVDDSL